MSIWISLTKIDGNRIIVKKDNVYSVEEIMIPDKNGLGSQYAKGLKVKAIEGILYDSETAEKQTKACVVTMMPLEGITYGDPLIVKDDYASINNRL